MITTPYDKYRQSAIQTSSPSQLLLMMYDGAIRFGRIAADGIEKSDFEVVNTNLGKAQTIVSELVTTLDNSYEISKGLSSLYEYINYLFVEANIKKLKEPLEEGLGYLLELRQTFAQAAKMAAGQELQHG